MVEIERAFDKETKALTHRDSNLSYDTMIELMDMPKYKKREYLRLSYYFALKDDDPFKRWMDDVFIPSHPIDSTMQYTLFFFKDRILAILCTQGISVNGRKTVHIVKDHWFGIDIHKRKPDDLIRKFFNEKLLEIIIDYLTDIQTTVYLSRMFELDETAFTEEDEPGIEEINGTIKCAQCGAEEDFTEEHGVLFCACGAKRTSP